MQHQRTDELIRTNTTLSLAVTRQNFHRVSFLGHLNLAKQHWLQAGFQCKQQSANTNTKLLTKHVSNTSQTKRAQCKRADFDDLSN